jgi:hypothetical protein
MKNLFGSPTTTKKISNNLFGTPKHSGQTKKLFASPNNNLFGEPNNKSLINDIKNEPQNNEIEKEIVEEEEEEDEKVYEESEPKLDEIENRKCSLTEHNQNKAIKFCPQCDIFMCNKCDIVHSGLLKNHYAINLDNSSNNIFTGICRRKNHSMKLEYFCNDHNQLCCAACIAKIRCKGNGYHKNCKIFYINKIKNIKKNKLNENIKFLEDLSSKLENSIKELKIIFEKINENKDTIKMQIQTIFTKIRNIVNNREDELLAEVDKKFNDLFFKEELIKESEKLTNKIKNSLEKGKAINKEWNDDTHLSSLLNDCLNIENDITKINEINENINKCNSNKDIDISFNPGEKEINYFLENFAQFGEIVHNKKEEKNIPLVEPLKMDDEDNKNSIIFK